MRLRYVLLILSVLAGLAVVVFVVDQTKNPQQGLQCSISEIRNNLDKASLCCVENGNLTYCDPNSLKCGQVIYYEINVSKLNPPSNFFLCADVMNQIGAGNLSYSSIRLEYGNRVFVCNPELLSRQDNIVVSDLGRIQNITGNETLVKLYVFPLGDYSNVTSFFSQKDAVNDTFSIQGEIRC